MLKWIGSDGTVVDGKTLEVVKEGDKDRKQESKISGIDLYYAMLFIGALIFLFYCAALA